MLNVGCDGSEPVGVRVCEDVDWNYPFEAVSGGACEQQLRVEVFIFKESGADDVTVLEVVEVDANQA